MSRKYNEIVILWQNICPYKGKGVILHRVFHSIRFKVNKGWTTAVVLFLCPYLSYGFRKLNFLKFFLVNIPRMVLVV